MHIHERRNDWMMDRLCYTPSIIAHTFFDPSKKTRNLRRAKSREPQAVNVFRHVAKSGLSTLMTKAIRDLAE